MEQVKTENAPKALGPYSQAIVSNNFVFVSGQIAINPKTNELVRGDIIKQTKQVLENLKHVLEAAGSSLDKAVKITVYLSDINEFAKMNEIYADYFVNKPARATMEVSKLPKNAMVEIDAVAER